MLRRISDLDADFDSEVLASAVPTLVDFWAARCGPCHWVAPQLERIAATDNRLRIAKLNVDENRAAASRFGVMSIPRLACSWRVWSAPASWAPPTANDHG